MSIPVKLPKNLPNVDINNPTFEAGFDEEFIEGGLPHSYNICGICRGFPRHPASLPMCGHLFCEMCIKELIDQYQKSHSPYDLIPCPLCRISFHAYGVITFSQFQYWAQGMYKSIEVKCPYGCGYKGNALEVDHHQVLICPKRRIKCPNESCQIVMPACEMEERHLHDCSFLLVSCPGCLLPVKAAELKSHCCHQKLAEAVTSMNSFSLFYYYGDEWCKWLHVRLKSERSGIETPQGPHHSWWRKG